MVGRAYGSGFRASSSAIQCLVHYLSFSTCTPAMEREGDITDLLCIVELVSGDSDRSVPRLSLAV